MLNQEIYNEKDTNIRLDIFLKNHIKNTSRSKIQKLIINGSIRIDDYIVKPSYILKGNECITIDTVKSKSSFDYLEKQDISFDVIYEDNDIIVINKPAGLIVHPGAGNKDRTLLNGLLYRFRELSKINALRPGIVHRLDKQTSGVMLVAKTDEAHYFLSEQFLNRTISKTYRAIVWGDTLCSGEIEGYISRDEKNRMRFKLNGSKGKFSSTKYKKLNSFSPFSYLELYPLTGRTHQIRVHLNSINHPIFLDDMYGGGDSLIKSYSSEYVPLINQALKKINRFALHAYQIEFIHPTLNKKVNFKAEIPKDISSLLDLIS
ncbi:MAG: RNA pseudouridine synthase [Candidatus Marinimicrobia bacterium]|nr:RNA pseudouridine synthase [Candidatus Neomarinimicrobiota bacterium]|tara:strand:- start:22474 stop:23427 length:954 start_codon:yes stop_codon:yes gene_type:complete